MEYVAAVAVLAFLTIALLGRWRRAYIIEGDTIGASRRSIRLADLDTPKMGQVAKHQYGGHYRQGRRLKSALIGESGVKYVFLAVHGYDKSDRVVDTLTCSGRDVGEYLVWNCYAAAAMEFVKESSSHNLLAP